MQVHMRAEGLFAIVAAGLLLVLPLGAAAEEQEHFLDFSEDSYKIAFLSGNFTAVVTRDIPRVVFLHNHAYLSPYFGVSFNKIYLFNDTDHDGFFEMSEAVYTSFLDLHHVNLNLSTVQFRNDSSVGEYAYITMRTTLSLWQGRGNASSSLPLVPDWANITFSFRITERAQDLSNSYGAYDIPGKTDMAVNFSLTILKHVPAEGIAFEAALHGGGSTYMFKLRPFADTPNEGSPLTLVSSRVDESIIGDNFTHRLARPPMPEQSILFSKENGTVQAHFRYSSEPTEGASGPQVPMNASYYTTGSGMILHLAYFLDPAADELHQETTLGIDEAGFILKVRDWFRDNLGALLIVVGSLAAIIALTMLVFMYRKYKREGESPEAK